MFSRAKINRVEDRNSFAEQAMRSILQTGQHLCFDAGGHEISCAGSGQDGEYHIGRPWPEPRFIIRQQTVIDALTGLTWSRDANPGTFPCTWPKALEQVKQLNHDHYCGFHDWRLPNRRELRSLMSYQDKKPALPGDHPFDNVFLGWYWSSTSAANNPAYAWYVHLEGARMFYGKKEQEYLFWPVRGEGYEALHATGQAKCFSAAGDEIPCQGTGQDGAYQKGAPWPQPRFTRNQNVVHDRLTGLSWAGDTNLAGKPVSWSQALQAVSRLNGSQSDSVAQWRLPSINELESLVDCSAHSPALPADHPFTTLREGYWSSTTSFFETDWAWVLYLAKGACGVGHKPGRTFFVWPVTTIP